MSIRLGALASVMLGLTASTSQAGFTFADFSSVAGLTLNGSAAQVGNVLRLTPATFNQGGSAFTTAPNPLGNLNSFSTYFQFRITENGTFGDGDGPGADGLVFVIQTQANNVGGSGGFIGYGGISPSVGIEFDTYNNGGGLGDPDGNHVGTDFNGNIASTMVTSEPTRFNNGQIWNAWVDYNGATDALEARWSLSSVRPGAAQLATTVDLVTLLGQDTAFLGFTSGTGSGYGNHDILSWVYRDAFDPIVVGVPEPSTWAMIAGGLMGLTLMRRTLRRGPSTSRN